MPTKRKKLIHSFLILLLLSPLLWYGITILFMQNPVEIISILLLSAITVPITIALYITLNKFHSHNTDITVSLEKDTKWMTLLYDNTDEIIMVLNEYAQVLSCNQTTTKELMLSHDEISGKPFRDIISGEHNLRMNEKILAKLKEVFFGEEVKLICSCRKKDNDIITVSFKLIPIMEGNELRNILVIGHIQHLDSLTKNYLIQESSKYTLDNDLSQIFLLCHRLTRNLENKLTNNDILMTQIALQEIFMNSVEHGNLDISYEYKTELKKRRGDYWTILIRECSEEFLHNRKIHVSYYMDRSMVRYTIRDEGKGFDWKKHMDADQELIEQGLMADCHGLGLQIVKNVFTIAFNESGNEVTLVKQFGY